MHFSSLVSFALVAIGLSRASQAAIPVTFNDTHISGGFLVELATGSGGKRGLEVDQVHSEFLAELDARAPGKFTTRKKYSSPLFNGIALQLHTPDDFVGLSGLQHVVAVRPIQILPLPRTLNTKQVSHPGDGGVFPDGESTHKMTGVDKAHAAGYTGKGVKIAVIDTGIDYTHPSLGGAFGPGHKVAGGLDLVGDNYLGFNDPVPDDDPRDTCVGHGTNS